MERRYKTLTDPDKYEPVFTEPEDFGPTWEGRWEDFVEPKGTFNFDNPEGYTQHEMFPPLNNPTSEEQRGIRHSWIRTELRAVVEDPFKLEIMTGYCEELLDANIVTIDDILKGIDSVRP